MCKYQSVYPERPAGTSAVNQSPHNTPWKSPQTPVNLNGVKAVLLLLNRSPAGVVFYLLARPEKQHAKENSSSRAGVLIKSAEYVSPFALI